MVIVAGWRALAAVAGGGSLADGGAWGASSLVARSNERGGGRGSLWLVLAGGCCRWRRALAAVAGGGHLTVGEACGVSSPVARNGERCGRRGRLVVGVTGGGRFAGGEALGAW